MSVTPRLPDDPDECQRLLHDLLRRNDELRQQAEDAQRQAEDARRIARRDRGRLQPAPGETRRTGRDAGALRAMSSATPRTPRRPGPGSSVRPPRPAIELPRPPSPTPGPGGGPGGTPRGETRPTISPTPHRTRPARGRRPAPAAAAWAAPHRRRPLGSSSSPAKLGVKVTSCPVRLAKCRDGVASPPVLRPSRRSRRELVAV